MRSKDAQKQLARTSLKNKFGRSPATSLNRGSAVLKDEVYKYQNKLYASLTRCVFNFDFNDNSNTRTVSYFKWQFSCFRKIGS